MSLLYGLLNMSLCPRRLDTFDCEATCGNCLHPKFQNHLHFSLPFPCLRSLTASWCVYLLHFLHACSTCSESGWHCLVPGLPGYPLKVQGGGTCTVHSLPLPSPLLSHKDVSILGSPQHHALESPTMWLELVHKVTLIGYIFIPF